MIIYLGPVDSFVTSGRPARALRQSVGVIGITNEDPTAGSLLLEVTLEAKRGVSGRQHSLIHRTVRRVTSDTTFAHGVMLKYEWASLRSVTLETGFVARQEGESAALHFLLKICIAPFDRITLVRVVAIGATHLAFQHRVMMRQLEAGSHFQVTLEAGLRIFQRVNDVAPAAAGFHMFATRYVARFAAHRLRVLAPSR